ncbi:MAG: BolA family transcriptional regulator [Xanthomonadales bacterium]|nr:BolA family transcriptional regulator [Xanthomonadales bacterium]MCB1640348.1 BolA family transcriptional regulator [Xanthomonadales bacterium]
MSGADRLARIEALLRQALEPTELEIVDEGHLHVGHAGARDGRGHYRVRLVSARFSGQSPLARHRLVYAALGDMLDSDIHALALKTLAPEEL